MPPFVRRIETRRVAVSFDCSSKTKGIRDDRDRPSLPPEIWLHELSQKRVILEQGDHVGADSICKARLCPCRWLHRLCLVGGALMPLKSETLRCPGRWCVETQQERDMAVGRS